MIITHHLLKHNFAGTPTDVTFRIPATNTLPYSRFTLTLPSDYMGIEGQGFTLFLAGQSIRFVFRNSCRDATELPMGTVWTDYVDMFLRALLRHPIVSLYCTGHKTGTSTIELRSVVLSDFAVPNSMSPVIIHHTNYSRSNRQTAVVHCAIQNIVVPSELSIIDNQAVMGLMELIDCEPITPNPAVPIRVQQPVQLHIRHALKQDGITESMQDTELYSFIAGSGDNRLLNPALSSNIYLIPLHDYQDNPVYVHHRQPNWMYLFCARNIGSPFPYDSGNAVIRFKCVFSDGTMYQTVIDEEMNFPMVEGNVYALPCGLEQMIPLSQVIANTPQGHVLDKYCFELVSLNRLVTYYEQYFFVDQRFKHPLEQTTFLLYDNGVGGYQTAFLSGTVQTLDKPEKLTYRNHKGQPESKVTSDFQTLDISTGYWDDECQLKRYQRIIKSPKVYLLHWQVKTTDKIALLPVCVTTDSIGLPADLQMSNAFVMSLERLI